MNDYEKGMLELGYDLVASFSGTEEFALTVSDVEKILKYAETVYDERITLMDCNNETPLERNQRRKWRRERSIRRWISKAV